MPGTVTCTNCQKVFRLPDSLLGKPVKCPECGTIFTAPRTANYDPNYEPAPAPAPEAPRTAAVWGPPEHPASAPPPPPPPPPPRPAIMAEDVSDIDEVDARAPSRPSVVLSPEEEVWRGIGVGAALQALAHGLYAGALLLLLLIMIIALDLESSSRGGRSGMQAFLTILVMFLSLALMANWVLSVVAGAFWVFAPNRAFARPLAIGLLVLNAVVLLRVPTLVGTITGFADRDSGMFRGDQMLANVLVTFLLDYARLIAFGFALSALSSNLRRGGIGMAVKLLAIATPCVLAGLFFLNLLVMLIDRPGKGVGIFVLFLNLAGIVGLLVWGALMLLRLWQLIQREQTAPVVPAVEAPVALPRGRDPRLR